MSHRLVLITRGEYSDYDVPADGLYRVPSELAEQMDREGKAVDEQASAIRRTQGYGAAYRAAEQRAEAVRRGWAKRIQAECEGVPFTELWTGGY